MSSTRRLLKPKNVRLPLELNARVEALARKHCVTKSDLIRQGLAIVLPDWERNGIHLTSIR